MKATKPNALKYATVNQPRETALAPSGQSGAGASPAAAITNSELLLLLLALVLSGISYAAGMLHGFLAHQEGHHTTGGEGVCLTVRERAWSNQLLILPPHLTLSFFCSRDAAGGAVRELHAANNVRGVFGLTRRRDVRVRASEDVCVF